ncbi:hypothetical protein N7481_002648 [Penicillium waksmanii]|uniref:uncharacterized protein n=1 Tax=Penicillium waksmanii TaxID=69791 RepID=UPI0025488D0A|nr:uncharacterized protein N7481_002648 [Penicillium waksmanii]KAJ5995671.1 hypothetical protein N7481_002648 [Penicillium waksmanii]
MPAGLSVAVLVVTWAETCVGLIFLTLRFLSSWKFTGRFRWDFWIATLAVATEAVAQIFLQLSVNAGMGDHAAELSEANLVEALKWGWVFQLLAIAASMLGKLAILAFLMQLRGRHFSKPWLLIILGLLIFSINITVMGTILGQCSPMEKLWNDDLPGTCNPGRKVNQNYSFFQASFNVFCDAALATYPVHLFWSLQMKWRIKVALSTLMGLGWIAAVCSAFKCYELRTLTKTKDVTYALSRLLIWASTEAWIVIVVGCVPPIRPLMEWVLQHLGFTNKENSYRHNDQRPSAYATYGRNQSHVISHSNYQRDRKTLRPGADELEWVELPDRRISSDSKGQILNDTDIIVTTEFRTQFEEHEPPHPRSSRGSQTSAECGGVRGPSTDTKNVI